MKQNISLALSAAALTFQVTVLYPWHNEISRQLQSLEARQCQSRQPQEGEKTKSEKTFEYVRVLPPRK